MKRTTLLAALGLACLVAVPSVAQARYQDEMNLYQYVRSRPTNLVDPKGLEPVPGGQGAGPVDTAQPPTSQRNYPENPVPVPSQAETEFWMDAFPLLSQCPQGMEDQCTRRTFSFGYTDPNLQTAAFAHNVKGGGSAYAVDSVAHMLATIGAELKSCQCIEELTIATHGGWMGQGGFNMPSQKYGDPNNIQMVSPNPRQKDTMKQWWPVFAFAQAIREVMCKPCSINIMSCEGGKGETARILSEVTGCSVTGSLGYTYLRADGTWSTGGDMGGDTVEYDPFLGPDRVFREGATGDTIW